MKQEDVIVYEQLRDTTFSQGCEGQAVGMLHACKDYLLSEFSLKHSLLRLALRALFYMGVERTDEVLSFIREYAEKFKDSEKLCEFVEDNEAMVSVIVDELMLCCDFYDTEYDSGKNAVTLEDTVFYNISDFEKYFTECFRKRNIPEEEIKRIFVEENYEKFFRR